MYEEIKKHMWENESSRFFILYVMLPISTSLFMRWCYDKIQNQRITRVRNQSNTFDIDENFMYLRPRQNVQGTQGNINRLQSPPPTVISHSSSSSESQEGGEEQDTISQGSSSTFVSNEEVCPYPNTSYKFYTEYLKECLMIHALDVTRNVHIADIDDYIRHNLNNIKSVRQFVDDFKALYSPNGPNAAIHDSYVPQDPTHGLNQSHQSIQSNQSNKSNLTNQSNQSHLRRSPRLNP